MNLFFEFFVFEFEYFNFFNFIIYLISIFLSKIIKTRIFFYNLLRLLNFNNYQIKIILFYLTIYTLRINFEIYF